MRLRRVSGLLLATSLCGCAGPERGGPSPKPSSTTDLAIAALRPVTLTSSKESEALGSRVQEYYQRNPGRRSYVMTDKPLYQPGETIWFRADVREAGTLAGALSMQVTAQLVSPRGAVVAEKHAMGQDGVAQGDFELGPDLEGGEYGLQITTPDGARDVRKVVVSNYEAPRLKKTLELLRKAYGEGDAVSAALEVKRGTGEAFAEKDVTGVVNVDGQEIHRLTLKTDKEGRATVRFDLPAKIGKGDGTLTVLADDGGVVESIQKRIPIVTKTLDLALFPEGGDLVEGLPGRVYFRARTPLGKPADVEGRVTDDRGEVVAELRSVHDGLGRFDLTPSKGRTYRVELAKPAGITARFDVPAAKPSGCVLRGVDAPAPVAAARDAGHTVAADTLRVAAVCSTSRTLLVEAALRDKRMAGGSVDVAPGKPVLVELAMPSRAQGAARVTLFGDDLEPLAERLVYQGRGHDLRVAITADRASYAPRDMVKLRVRATDETGAPTKANLGLAVVDDKVLSFADDKSGRVLAKTFLEPELRVTDEDPIEEPNFYFGDKPEAASAMDALLATRGYRKFEWRQVLAPKAKDESIAVPTAFAAAATPPAAVAPVPEAALARPGAARADDANARKGAPRPAAPVAPAALAAAASAAPAANKAPATPVARRPMVNAAGPAPAATMAPGQAPMAARGRAAAPMMKEAKMDMDEAWGGGGAGLAAPYWAPVRVFPIPTYARGYDGPRTDFRETVYWNASVQTKDDGEAEVSFPVSDAVTSFRVVAEGFSSAGLAGGGEKVIASKMPVSLDAILPVEVASGDTVRIPVTLTNETDRALRADLAASFGPAFKRLDGKAGSMAIELAPGEKRALFYPLEVIAGEAEAKASVSLRSAGLSDAIEKPIRVVPKGFPFEIGASGTLKGGGSAKLEVDLTFALPGSVHATVSMFPSPVASMTEGMAGMLREPGGCFEQTSATNYPNVMILQYLAVNDASDPALVSKSQALLDHGYKILAGYETKNKGYEWFGQTPGHEALTAYGLMEFADMGKVYDVDRAMVERTASWLMSRRDGKGGFLRDAKALDSFGRASEATTNAYIVWALAEAKRTAGLDKELAVNRALGAATNDPYLLALATNVAWLTQPKAPETEAMTKRLAAMQAKDGSFPGAKESITVSGGDSLLVETTALAVQALVKASPNNEHETAIRAAVDRLNAGRGSFAQWGNTQATILSLKALGAYAEHARQTQAPGKATLVVNGKDVGVLAFDKGRRDALTWTGDALEKALRPGPNKVELRLDSQATLPYTVSVSYRAAQPASSRDAKVAVTVSADKARVKAGEAVKMHAHVENTTKDGVPMTVARIGIPGGLAFQTWQLKELREKGLVDFYETRPREVILYWRSLAPAAKKDVDIDLLARLPGTFEAPASSAYLYYTAEHKAWVPPVTVRVD
jgi:hypothetical protein